MIVSICACLYSSYTHTLRVGLQSYLPARVNHILTQVSIYDILIDVVIYGTFLKNS